MCDGNCQFIFLKHVNGSTSEFFIRKSSVGCSHVVRQQTLPTACLMVGSLLQNLTDLYEISYVYNKVKFNDYLALKTIETGKMLHLYALNFNCQ